MSGGVEIIVQMHVRAIQFLRCSGMYFPVKRLHSAFLCVLWTVLLFFALYFLNCVGMLLLLWIHLMTNFHSVLVEFYRGWQFRGNFIVCLMASKWNQEFIMNDLLGSMLVLMFRWFEAVKLTLAWLSNTCCIWHCWVTHI